MTFREGLAALLAHMRLNGYSPATIRNTTQQLERFGEWLPQQRVRSLRAVTPGTVREYQAHVRSERVARATKSLRTRAVKQLFCFLVDQGRLLLDPTAGLETPRRGRSLPRPVLSHREMHRLLAVPRTHTRYGIRNRALLEVFYGAGVRVGELEHASVDDVDLRAQTLHLLHTKGDRPRVVPLGRNATYWLGKYLEEVRPDLAKGRPRERALFVVQGGRPLRQVIMRQMLARNRERAKIRKAVFPHVLRHTCATHLLRAGADLRSIQELLGHARISTTTLYTRVAAAEVKATHERYHPRNQRHAAR